VSPAWLSWVAAVPALRAVERAGIDAIHEHDVGLANRFRAGLAMPPSNSAMVTTALPGAAQRLQADVDLALEARRA
jgi:hypothetical protein